MKKVFFEEERVRKHLEFLSFNLKHVDLADLMIDICKSVYQNISTSEIEALLLASTKTRIEQHYDYSLLSARLLLHRLYKDNIGVSLGDDDLIQKIPERFHYLSQRRGGK